jgi:poly(3-hydroxybutyrate) depolymerase
MINNCIAMCRRLLERRAANFKIARWVALASGAIVAVALTSPLTATGHETDQPPIEQSSVPSTATPVSELVAEIAVQLSATSSGCGKRALHTGLFNLHTTDGHHVTRTFLVQLPPTYNASRAYPLIFVFHGAGGNSSQSYSWGLQNVNEASEVNESSDNGIFVFPDGINFQHYGVGWDDTKSGYDMPFFDNMLKSLEADFCVNGKRVFVAGFSWGGDFVTALACARGSVIRAAAANSTTDEYSNTNNFATYHNLPCPTNTHPAVRFEHAVGGDSAYPAPRFATTAVLFRHFNSCSAASTSVRSSTNVMSCRSYNSCAKEFIEIVLTM